MNTIDDGCSTLILKLTKCMRFIAILKRAIAKQYFVTNVCHRCNAVIICVARTLMHKRNTEEHRNDESENMNTNQRRKASLSVRNLISECYKGLFAHQRRIRSLGFSKHRRFIGFADKLEGYSC